MATKSRKPRGIESAQQEKKEISKLISSLETGQLSEKNTIGNTLGSAARYTLPLT